MNVPNVALVSFHQYFFLFPSRCRIKPSLHGIHENCLIILAMSEVSLILFSEFTILFLNQSINFYSLVPIILDFIRTKWFVDWKKGQGRRTSSGSHIWWVSNLLEWLQNCSKWGVQGFATNHCIMKSLREDQRICYYGLLDLKPLTRNPSVQIDP